MNGQAERHQVLAGLSGSARAIRRAAENESLLRELVDAFRASDGDEFQRILALLEITECEVVCFWLRSEECVLECVELCGFPEKAIKVEEIPRFAEAIVKITANEKWMERLAEAVLDRDPEVFNELIEELELQRVCHLLCHWACSIHWRMVCELVCSPRRIPMRHLVSELRSAGAAMRRLASNKKNLDEVIEAVAAFDCWPVNNMSGEGGDCHWICEWSCSWKCALVCLPACGPFLQAKRDTSIAETRGFAQACDELEMRDGALQRLVVAELEHDMEAFAALVRMYSLERYCLQLCHWICSSICHRLYICVSRPPITVPLFTHLGNYRVRDVYGDFNSNETTSNHGFALTQRIELKGILPHDQAPGAYQYRFTCKNNGAGATNPVLAPTVPATMIGQLEYWEYVAGVWQPVRRTMG
ncbi:MAG: hypothetical protein ABI178_07365 [Rhodanobacter sp.]